MKKIFFLIIPFLWQPVMAQYKVTQIADAKKSYLLQTVRDGAGNEVAKFCLVDEDPFYFYSVAGEPDLFPEIEKNIFRLAARKGRGEPQCLFLLDFDGQVRSKQPFSLRYLLYRGALMFAPPYVRSVDILSFKKTSRRFFVETEIDGRDFYGALVFPRPTDIAGAKRLLKALGQKFGLINPAVEDVPAKMVIYKNGHPTTLYESHEGHSHFSCCFFAGSNP